MFKKVSDWFKQQLEQPEQQDDHTIELATAVLMYEIMRADDKFEQQERDVFAAMLNKHFSLSDLQVAELSELTTHTAHQAADFVQFTRIINNKYDMQQKRAVLDALWMVAFADGTLDAQEEHLIRRIADLLYIPHSQFIQSKLAAQNHN